MNLCWCYSMFLMKEFRASQGAIISSIGYGINAVISAIASIIETIVAAIVAVRAVCFQIL